MEIKITINYKYPGVTGMNEFNNLQEMKMWLDKHPELAKHLGYKKPLGYDPNILNRNPKTNINGSL
jgi:hypothetical protein